MKPAGAVLHGTVVDGTGVVVAGLRVAAPVVARIRDRALRGVYARMLAGWLGLDEVEVRRAVGQAVRTSLIVVVTIVLLISLAVYGASGNFNLSG